MIRLLAAALAFGTLLVGCASAPGTSLTGYAWQWAGSTTTTPASQSVVPDPQNYTIEFKPDQTFQAKADCNQVSGGWTSTQGNGIDITPGPSTMAACGPNSLADEFVAGLDKASAYVLAENKTLTLVLAQEGTMGFK
jgi:heat shock protein HslJ